MDQLTLIFRVSVKPKLIANTRISTCCTNDYLVLGILLFMFVQVHIKSCFLISFRPICLFVKNTGLFWVSACYFHWRCHNMYHTYGTRENAVNVALHVCRVFKVRHTITKIHMSMKGCKDRTLDCKFVIKLNPMAPLGTHIIMQRFWSIPLLGVARQTMMPNKQPYIVCPVFSDTHYGLAVLNYIKRFVSV